MELRRPVPARGLPLTLPAGTCPQCGQPLVSLLTRVELAAHYLVTEGTCAAGHPYLHSESLARTPDVDA